MILTFLVTLGQGSCCASEAVDITAFTHEIQNYSNDIFPEFTSSNWITEMMSGNLALDGQNILKRVLHLFTNELKENREILFKIIAISLLCSLLMHLQNHFNGNVSEIAFYICYMLIILLVITTFTNITGISLKVITKLKNFMNVVIPVLITLLLTMGNMTTVATLQPVLLTMISIITTLISNLVIPIIMISTILSLVSNISQEIKVDAVSKFLKKSVTYLVELVMIIFLGVLSLEGTLAAGVDGVTSKITKTVVSNTVPVVGKLLR